MEVGILQMLNSKADPGNKHHIVRMCDFFVHRLHLCLVFELLAVNLYELIKRNQFRGLSIGLLRVFITQARIWIIRPAIGSTIAAGCACSALIEHAGISGLASFKMLTTQSLTALGGYHNS